MPKLKTADWSGIRGIQLAFMAFVIYHDVPLQSLELFHGLRQHVIVEYARNARVRRAVCTHQSAQPRGYIPVT